METNFLIKRLKPQYKAILQNRNIDYPTIISSIIEELETKEYVRDLSYGCFMDMRFFFNSDSAYDYFTE